ncbi:MAG: transcription antitermination factor NusB [Spirochaetaceae bacterium]
MGLRRKGRIIAFQALYFWDVSHPELSDLLQFTWLDEPQEEEPDNADEPERPLVPPEGARVFARLLVSGAIENIDDIDRAIRERLEHWDFSRLSWVDRAILRIGTYELLFRPDVPASVVIDEAIAVARRFGAEDSFRFINGVLDGVKRRQEGTGA